MFFNRILILITVGVLLACNNNTSSEKKTAPAIGIWQMEMNLNGHVLPFNFSLDKKEGNYEMLIMNAEENILITDIKQERDSLFIDLPVFESTFKLAINSASKLSGFWVNYYKGDNYKIPSKAVFDREVRV